MASSDRNPLTSSSTTPDDRLNIVCFHCGKPQDISRRAMSVTCKFCYKRLTIQDEVM